MMIKFLALRQKLDAAFEVLRYADFVAPLGLRIYLFFPLWLAGTTKLAGFENTVQWFGNSEWGLGLPLPTLMAFLATWTEILGALLVLVGFATRYITVPLMVVMLVAAFSVHWEQGWSVIANSASDPEVAVRLARAKEILQTHGHYQWLTDKGNFVILNNGIEFAVTYFLMLLVLFFQGAGRYCSVDYWLERYCQRVSQCHRT